MEIEQNITYDEIINNSYPFSQSFLSNCKAYKILNRPPFLILTEKESDDSLDFILRDILNFSVEIQNTIECLKKSFLINNKYYYLIKYEENLILAKNGDDNAILFFGFPNIRGVNLVGIFEKFSQKKHIILNKMIKIKKFIDEEIKS